MESEILKALLESASALSGPVVAILVTTTFCYCLVKGKIFLAPQLEPILLTCKENTEALKVANAELARVNILLAKAEVERELVWKSRAASTFIPSPEAAH